MPKPVQSAYPANALQRYTATDGRQSLQVDETVVPVVDLAELERGPHGAAASSPFSITLDPGFVGIGNRRFYLITPRDTTGLIALEIEHVFILPESQNSFVEFWWVPSDTLANLPPWDGLTHFTDLPNLNAPTTQQDSIALTRGVYQAGQSTANGTGKLVGVLKWDINELGTKWFRFPRGTMVRGRQRLGILGVGNNNFRATVTGRTWYNARPRTEP